MCEPEALILAVKKHPCLWNIYDKEYYTKDVKQLAWEQVFTEIIRDWDTCSQVDKENKAYDLKKKWTNIRDYFRRDLLKTQHSPTGSAAKKKKYVFSNLLNFLIPIFDKKVTEGNNENNDSEDSSQVPESERQEEDAAQQDYNTNMKSPTPPSTPSQTPYAVSNIKREQEDAHIQILNVHQNQQRTNQGIQEEDDDTKFLLSFREHMKQLNGDQKIDFKIGMLQLVKKINTEYYSSSLQNFIKKSDSPTHDEYSSYSQVPEFITSSP
ncbi:unnamed protein product [Chrysodeixis includens]|uniref:MADF domain-containing protein n=1 Tax=Chrysodeixis includens TaxID=689277 RepID=A0A9P0BSY1_CHRIL|nr:unnamed protein product [Chrysodeixis includens]